MWRPLAQVRAAQVISAAPGYLIVLVHVAIILAIAAAATIGVRRLVRRLEARLGHGDGPDAARAVALKRAQTLGEVLRAAASAIIWAVALLVALGEARINI